MNKFKAAQVWSSAYSPSRSLRHLHEGEGCPGSRADAPERTCSEPLAVGVPGGRRPGPTALCPPETKSLLTPW